MPKRRNVLMGLGAIAVGSGALSAAALSDSVSPDADFRIIAAADLRARRGNSFTEEPPADYVVEGYDDEDPGDSQVDFSEIGAPDLDDGMIAWADDDENGDLEVQLGFQNRSVTRTFDDFLEIENHGDTVESVGIHYDGGYADPTEEEWYDNSYSDESADPITRYDVQEIFQFEVTEDELNDLDAYDDHGSDEVITPSPGDDTETPQFFIELGPSESVQLDVVASLNGDQVSTFAAEADAETPFSDPDASPIQLLEEINVGTESD